MNVGDRVAVSTQKGHRLGFLNGLRGTVVEPGANQFPDEASVIIDGTGPEGGSSYYYIPLDVLVPLGTTESAAVQIDQVMPVESAARKDVPVTTGVFDYFPAALAYVARVSKAGNEKHNPGEPLHWARGKSTDQADAIGRHLIDRGGTDPDTGLRHSGELAWRALALLQLELEAAGEAPLARGGVGMRRYRGVGHVPRTSDPTMITRPMVHDPRCTEPRVVQHCKCGVNFSCLTCRWGSGGSCPCLQAAPITFTREPDHEH